MAELTQQKPIIRITFDEMEAYMLLPEPEQGTGYTDAQIRQEMAYIQCRASDRAGEEAGGWNGRLLRIQVRHEL